MLLQILAAATTTGSAPAVGVLPLRSGDYLHFEGNSITNNHLASGLDALVMEWMTANGITGITASVGGGTGTNGQTWDDMGNGRADVAQGFDVAAAATRRILVLSEGTNSAIVAGQSAAVMAAAAKRTIALMRADRPWDAVICWEPVPFGHGDWATYPSEQTWNLDVMAVSDEMAADPLGFGLDAFVRTRPQSPQFDHDGHDSSVFVAYQSAWNETLPSTYGWLHPKDGTFSPPTGKRAIAAAIAAALTDGRLPAAP